MNNPSCGMQLWGVSGEQQEQLSANGREENYLKRFCFHGMALRNAHGPCGTKGRCPVAHSALVSFTLAADLPFLLLISKGCTQRSWRQSP